ncbi:UNVERIFIED_CONTAM: hypothetical protein GTU68_018247, partial [Idotea baltica]|nr:hypothetical protein [Idotea baltica]
FFEIARFPGCNGCIDCTHIEICSPGGNEAEAYRNRKGKFSLNCQAVVDPDHIIISANVMWPGSVHDSRIFENSYIKTVIQNIPGHLIGDSGYACRRFLMTPILNPTTQREVNYNKSLSKTRMKVECTFGIVKRRFACTDMKIRTNLRTSIAIIISCFVLHNYAIMHNRADAEGQAKRRNIIRNYFN